jgi:hypothetical protein
MENRNTNEYVIVLIAFAVPMDDRKYKVSGKISAVSG